MEPIYTGSQVIHRDGRKYSAEVSLRFRPIWGATGVGFSSEVERYLNSTFGADRAVRGDDIWQTVVKMLRAGEWCLSKQVGLEATKASTFNAEVVHVRVSESLSPEDLSYLLSEASRKATEQYLAALDDGRVRLDASDVDRPFEYLPSQGFDEEFIARRQCFLEYVAENRPGFLFSFGSSQRRTIEETRGERTLTHSGKSDFRLAVLGYLCGCRPEANALVVRSHQLLTLAEDLNEKIVGEPTTGWHVGRRCAALAYVHWLRTGRLHDEALAKARSRLLSYYRRTKQFDRRSANLAAPTLLFLEADEVLIAMEERLAAKPGRGAKRPGGLFGDVLRIATAGDDAEKERLKAKLRKRMPLHLFRWMHHGWYGDVAFILHAIFPRPEGPPSRLIERAWDYMPELKRDPGALFGWDIARVKSGKVARN